MLNVTRVGVDLAKIQVCAPVASKSQGEQSNQVVR